MTLLVRFTWITTTPLAIHSGLARAGGTDRAVRASGNAGALCPELPGEAVKGAIREAAERILRWRGKNSESEKPDRSVPTHPALNRLFAPDWTAGSSARYFFSGVETSQGSTVSLSATKIDQDTGTAAHNTLRMIEVWNGEIRFEVTVRAEHGDWKPGGSDHRDLCLLLMAIASVETIGSGWGVGWGGLKIHDLKYTSGSGGETQTMEAALRDHDIRKDFDFWIGDASS